MRDLRFLSTTLALSLCLATASSHAADAPAPTPASIPLAATNQPNLLSNGNFENGTAGWEWEQWIKEKPLPGAVDKTDHAPGCTASFRMALPGTTGGRDFYYSVHNLKRPGQSYLLSFWLKPTGMPEGAARVRVTHGWGWVIKSDTDQQDMAVTGGTHEWKQFSVGIRPQPSGALGDATIHFYNDQMGQGTLGIDGVSLRVASPEELDELADAAAAARGGAATAPAGPNLITNGSFEAGMSGWGYEEWSNRPIPGTVDKQDRAKDCPAAFKMGLPGTAGGRWIAHEVALTQPGASYLLSFYLKTQDLPGGAAYVRVGREGKGWLGSDDGKSDVVKVGGTHDWRRYTVPIHAKDLGDCKKLSLFIYNDRMGEGTLGIAGVALRLATEAQLAAVRSPSLDVDSFEQQFTGDTNRPDDSTFAVGEKVELKLHLVGAAQPKAPLSVSLDIFDEHDQPVESKKVPVTIDAEGEWLGTVPMPTPRLGFYRVKAKLSDGTPVAALGTRPAGFVTYVVVPDPKKRVDYGDTNSHFAMQGTFGAELCSRLGVRWTLDSRLEWSRAEPDHAGQFGPDEAKKFIADDKAGGPSFRVGVVPTLFHYTTWGTVPSTAIYMTGTLTPEGEKAWAAYCKVAAKAFADKYPEMKQHVYQITWEPIPPWGFKGTNADLVRIYQIAYPAIHEADPNAIVAGPCRGLYNNGDPAETGNLLKAGLGKYIDGYAVHSYHSTTPEKDGMPQDIRAMKETLRAGTGKDIPMYGTEQGLPTDEDISKELETAQVLMRQNLITLGEGFEFNFAFTLYDYRMAGSRTGYGYYYNLVPGVPFGPSKMCPKAIVAAYAAQSMLLEGSKSVGAIEWLGNQVWGYAFERPDVTMLALWNYGTGTRDVSIPTGMKQVEVIDWMGNSKKVDTTGGAISLKLGSDPVYISGVSPQLWGSEAAKLLSVEARQLKLYPGQHATVAGKTMMPADKPLQASLVLEDPSGVLPPLSRQVSLGAGAAAAFQFDVEALPKLAIGSHTLHLRLRNAAGETMTATTLNLEVLSPVTVSTAVAFTPEGKPALAVVLQEKQGLTASGRLDVNLKELIPGADRGDAPMIDLVADPGKSKDVPGAGRQIQFELPAKGSKRVLVDFGDAALAPARRYESLVKLATATGTTFSQTAPAQFLGAEHLAKALTIDGDLADWPAMTPVTLTGPQDVVRSPQYFPAKLTARLRYAWDAQALYLATEVDDDIFVQQRSGADIWSQDCLQLAFNLDARPSAGADAAETGDRRTCEINVALTKSGPQAFRSNSSSEAKRPTGPLTPQQLHLAVKQIEGGKLRYEMAIPWTTLGLAAGQSFKPGDAIGVAVAVNEVRSADQQDPCALGLFGGIADKNPDKFGILTLK